MQIRTDLALEQRELMTGKATDNVLVRKRRLGAA